MDVSRLGVVLVSVNQCYLQLSKTYVASKFMIDTGAGVVDADYRGTVFVLLFNLSDQDFEGKFALSTWIVTPLTRQKS